MSNIRWMKKKNGKLVLQQNRGIGTDGWGHVVFGWVDVETVKEPASASAPSDDRLVQPQSLGCGDSSLTRPQPGGAVAGEERCPTCNVTDAGYSVFVKGWCRDPWHGDDHLRSKAKSGGAVAVNAFPSHQHPHGE